MTRRTIGAMADLAGPMALRVAATLGIVDHVVAGRTKPAEVAAAVDADADAVARLMRHLLQVGVLDGGPDGYGVTSLGDQLRDDHPEGRRRWLDIAGGVGRGDLAFVDLLTSVRTGRAAYAVRYGSEFWADLEAHPELSASFDDLMNHHLERDRVEIESVFPWDSVTHVVDVGGGSGGLLARLLEHHPHLRGTLVDLPRPASHAAERFRGRGLGDRAEVSAQSFFDPLPVGADVYVLCAILHDWSDTEATALLRRCAEAMRPGSVLLVVESTGADGESADSRMDLRMLVYTGGKERGVAELAGLCSRVGLVLAEVRSAGGRAHMSAIEFRAHG